MRLFEFDQTHFYLGSEAPLKGIVEANDIALRLTRDREAKLEQRRPAYYQPRSSSFLISDHLSGWITEHIYAVRAIGEIQRLHGGWLNHLEGCDMTHDGVASHFADGYWSGQEMPEDRNAPWEHRAAKLEIIKRVGGRPQEYLVQNLV